MSAASRFTSCALWLVTALWLSPAARAGEDDYVRWSLLPPSPGPWQLLRYEITRRPPATTAVHRRRLPTASEADHALGLLTPEESDAFFASVRALDPFALASDPGVSSESLPSGARPDPTRARFACDLLLDGRAHQVLVQDPASHANPSIRKLFDQTASLVLAHAGDLPFRDIFAPIPERGWLNVESIPAARVTLDGLDTQLTSPVYGLEVRSGARTVTLTSLDGRLTRTFTPQIAPRGTTTLRVDLR
jgi:hypothetical protein